MTIVFYIGVVTIAIAFVVMTLIRKVMKYKYRKMNNGGKKI